MNANEILKKHEDANEMHFHEVDREWIIEAMEEYAALRQTDVSCSCSCGIPYVETKKSDIPYDTDDNVYYTDILIHHCPKCGNIDRIDEY